MAIPGRDERERRAEAVRRTIENRRRLKPRGVESSRGADKNVDLNTGVAPEVLELAPKDSGERG